MDRKGQDIAYFLSFCIEQYKNAKGMDGAEVMETFAKYGVLDYLNEHFEILHTQSRQWLLEDIEEFIQIRKGDSIMMNLTINQNNLYLLLPSKMSWLASMLADDRNMSIVDAIKKLYSSELYKKLEIESTKTWHLGPVALYEEFTEGESL